MKSILFTFNAMSVPLNYGELLLAAICKKAGAKTDCVPYTELKGKMENFDIIGFSFVTERDFYMARPYIEEARAAGKQIIAGGFYAIKGGRIENVDYICRGEAEDSIVSFLNGNEEAFIDGYIRPTIDGLPLPDLSEFMKQSFRLNKENCIFYYSVSKIREILQGLKKLPGVIPYETSRDCFLGRSTEDEQCEINKKVRIKHTIVGDIEFLTRTYKCNFISLLDSTIPYCFPEWREQFSKINIPFQGFIWVDITQSDLEFLINHGLKYTEFGIGSPDEKYRSEVLKKGVADDQIIRTVDILKEHEVGFCAKFIERFPMTQKRRDDVAGFLKMIEGPGMISQYKEDWEKDWQCDVIHYKKFILWWMPG